MSSIHDYATWEPLIRVVSEGNASALATPGGYVTGRVGVGSWSVPMPRRTPPPGRAMLVSDMQDEWDAVQRVRDTLIAGGVDSVGFLLETPGRPVLHLFDHGPAVEPGLQGSYPGALLLVEGAVAHAWRQRPEEFPGRGPAPAADAALLERTLRERLPNAIGATEDEIAAAEARLGLALPDELKAVYRVVRAHWQDENEDHIGVLGVDLAPLEGLEIADAASRPTMWQFAADVTLRTGPGDAVQDLVGSPGWIVFGGNGGGDRFAVDLTPGPAGHTGQIIFISHEDSSGATLHADSLTDMVAGRKPSRPVAAASEEPPAAVWVNINSTRSIAEAAHPGLEVLQIGFWDGEPFSLEPVADLPRLRTLSAYPGTLADPREIGRLTGLEFLMLPPEEWRVLLDARAVPRSLLAAGIQVNSGNPIPVLDLADELLALWNRPRIARTVLEGSRSA
ncbi:SMI1/KNR4 family protein [Actinoplanes italicus]|uniref:SMI1/KNR4 family protein SUKH-1 n=1 Tax=Actinoplanes italicus TaxID=113567 RepID=A0A2T0JX58_9ACTN|nr:SMI1/KNR4 family protein [Actinoplanes italicus]PRX12067.1 SMI1/KNR4 family protein SUKH-1 [Actinoplanes italicus]GIE30862.1 SMI1/KNR4 family protein [Actinoplanes italicus]